MALKQFSHLLMIANCRNWLRQQSQQNQSNENNILSHWPWCHSDCCSCAHSKVFFPIPLEKFGIVRKGFRVTGQMYNIYIYILFLQHSAEATWIAPVAIWLWVYKATSWTNSPIILAILVGGRGCKKYAKKSLGTFLLAHLEPTGREAVILHFSGYETKFRTSKGLGLLTAGPVHLGFQGSVWIYPNYPPFFNIYHYHP